MDYTHFFRLSLVPKSRIASSVELKTTKARPPGNQGGVPGTLKALK